MAHKKGPEATILRDCLHLLEALRIPAWRSNSGGVSGTYTSKRTGKTKRRFIKFAGIEGLSDITGIIPECCTPSGAHMAGVFLAVEVKAPGNRATDKQLDYLDMIQKAGGAALIVHSAEELLEDLKQLDARGVS